MNRNFGMALLTGASALACAWTANALAATEELELQEVVVTGSRVITDGNDSPTPLTVVNVEQLGKLLPTTITEQVNLMPALQGSQNVTSNAGGGQRNGAGSYFNLRNMSNLRTLNLVDGFRLVPTINQNQADVDSSIVPQMLLQRVDLVTGGVSAIYGSDAISGVINFITDKNFNGVKINATGGMSQRHDDKMWDVGIAAGTGVFGGRGHVEGSYQHHYDPGIFDRTTREFFNRRFGTTGAGSVTDPIRSVDYTSTSNSSFGGLVTNVAANGAVGPTSLRDQIFTPSGTLTPFVHGTTNTATTEYGNPNASGTYGNASIKSATIFDQAFGRFDYDLTDTLHGFVQGSYTNNHTYNNVAGANILSILVSNSNPFLASVQEPFKTTLAANPNGTLTFSRLLTPDVRADQSTIAHYIQAGLDGSLFDDYKWNVGIQTAQSELTARAMQNMDNGQLFAAIDAVRNSSGQIICRASQTNAAYAGCVPLNLFGQGQASEAALDYVQQEVNNVNTTKLESANASITGAPFNTWAGPVNMALSGEYRRLRWDVTSNVGPNAPNDLANCAGIQYNCNPNANTKTAKWFFNTQGGLDQVTQEVAEAAYEVNLPLVVDVPFVQKFDLSGAVRRTNYNTSGYVTSWKAGANWEINDNVTFRATRSRDIRAPNLFDLYQPIQLNPNTVWNDRIHTGVNSSTIVPNTQVGNPELTPEKGDTVTVGAVFRPGFIPGLSLSVDYFHIKVSDVIFLLAGRSDQVQQQCEDSGGTSSLCALITRPLPFSNRTPANYPTSSLSVPLNIAKLDTWGIDYELNYRTKVWNHGLTLRALVSYQPELVYDQGPAGVFDIANSVATGVNLFPSTPNLKGTAIISYDVTERFNVSVLERYRGRMKQSALAPTPTANNYQQMTVPSILYTTLNMSYKLQSDLVSSAEVFLNITNLTDKFPSPPLVTGDDVVGRYYTVGVRVKL